MRRGTSQVLKGEGMGEDQRKEGRREERESWGGG